MKFSSNISLIIIITAMMSQAAESDSKEDAAAGKHTLQIITHPEQLTTETQVQEKVLEECIVHLPDPAEMEPDFKAETKYLKIIDGDSALNGYRQIYRASFDIHYQTRQKVLILVTQSGNQPKDPVFKEVNRTLNKEILIESEDEDGDLTAGVSPMKRYFSSREKAAASLMQKTKAAISQKKSLLCK